MTESRAKIVSSVTSPLGFFVLAVLVVEAGLGGLVITDQIDTENQRAVLQGMMILLGLLILSVFVLTFVKPEALAEQKERQSPTPKLTLGPSKDLNGLDLSLVNWKNDACFLEGGGVRANIDLVPSPPGPGLRLIVNKETVQQLKADTTYRLELEDSHGIRWYARNFLFFEAVESLVCDDNQAAIEKYMMNDEEEQ